MPRAVDDDFLALGEFINSYSLKTAMADHDFVVCLKHGHRTYFCLLHFWSHMQFLACKGKLSIDGVEVTPENPILVYMKECVSDIGSGLFCCFHGAYKPASMSLRSSVENFLRFYAGLSDPEALKTSSVFDLFDVAAKTQQFAGAGKKFRFQLRGVYSELCKDTHTASLDHVARIHSMNYFQRFESNEFKRWTKLSNQVVVAVATVLTLASPKLLLKAHFKTQENIEPIIATKERKALLAGHKD